MKVRVTHTLDVDVDAWMTTYGVEREAVAADVRTWAANLLLDAATENGTLVVRVEACPACGHEIEWDVTHDPHAWRHVEHDSRWCSLDDTKLRDSAGGPHYPAGACDPMRMNATLVKVSWAVNG